MKYSMLCCVIVMVLARAGSVEACSPRWYDPSGFNALNMAWTENSACLGDMNFTFAQVQGVFNLWLAQANVVSGETFRVVVGSYGANAIEGDGGSICDAVDQIVPMGCTELSAIDDHGQTRIDYWTIHINESINWSVYSRMAVLTHEIGHAMGMWHAMDICGSSCATCKADCTGDNLPTMISCTRGNNCESCGVLLSNPTAITLSPADTAELQNKYGGAVHNEPTAGGGYDGEHVIPRPTEGRARCFPNPFNPMTRISVEGPGGLRVGERYELIIVDALGHATYRFSGRLENAAAKLELEWNGLTSAGTPAAAGTYGVVFSTDRFVAYTSATLLK